MPVGESNVFVGRVQPEAQGARTIWSGPSHRLRRFVWGVGSTIPRPSVPPRFLPRVGGALRRGKRNFLVQLRGPRDQLIEGRVVDHRTAGPPRGGANAPAD